MDTKEIDNIVNIASKIHIDNVKSMSDAELSNTLYKLLQAKYRLMFLYDNPNERNIVIKASEILKKEQLRRSLSVRGIKYKNGKIIGVNLER